MKLFILFFIFTFFAFSKNDALVSQNNQESKLKNDIVNSNTQIILNDIKLFIKNRFLHFYKNYNIQIDDISITPAMNVNLSKMKIEKIIFDDKLLSRDSGNFEVYLTHNEKRQRVFFTFNINAVIDALSATNNIKTNEVISFANSQISSFRIERSIQLPANSNIINEYSAKSFIPSGSIITPARIKPKVIVKKGDVVEVLYNEDGFNISFNARALEDGSINQNINAQNIQSDKIINIKILSPKSAKMQ